MKRIISLLIIAVGLLCAVPADAQIRFGVKGGLNMSELDWHGGIDGNSENTAGFFIGPMAEFTIPVIGLGVDAALMYSQRGKDELKQQGVEIPLNLKYTFGLGSTLGIYVLAGPDFFFNCKDMDGIDELDVIDTKKAQVAINLGAGVKLLRDLQLGVNYQLPLGDTLEDKMGVVSAKTKNWQVSLAYMF